MRVFAACVGGWLALWLLTVATLKHSWFVPLSCALTIGILYIAAAASGARGWSLFRLLAFLYGGIFVVNIQIESLAFNVVPAGEVMRSMIVGMFEVVGVSALLAIAIAREHSGGIAPSRRLPRWLWLRVPAVALSYIVLYFIAGTLILPFVRHFYRGNDTIVVPPLGVIVGTQMVRGLIYAVALMPLLREMEGRRAHAALIAGLSLSILGGIAPLLLPVDDVLPPDVRAAHMLEILGSNFILGVIAAMLLVRRTTSRSEAAELTGRNFELTTGN